MSFDLKNRVHQQWVEKTFSACTPGTVSGESNSMVLEFTNNGELYLYNKGFGGQTGGNINTGLTWTDLQQDSWTNLSIVSDLSSQTLSVYVNGALAGTITEWQSILPRPDRLPVWSFFWKYPPHERHYGYQQHQIL